MARIARSLTLATASPSRVLTLPELKKEAREKHKSHICFEKFVVGMLDAHVLTNQHHPAPGPRAEVGMFVPLRRELHHYYPPVAPHVRRCRALILERLGNRHFGSLSKILRKARGAFTFGWYVTAEMFEYLTIKQQYNIISKTDVLVSAGGSGSHLALFLPETSVSIVVETRGYDVNENICKFASHMKCFAVKSTTANDSVYPHMSSLQTAFHLAHKYVSRTCL
uniref:Glycosyltransferase 61 catalytic domain-containing protein n=1 Tax=Tetraselmis sp. GSL018 TaxID=582737 RepID=A0A061R0R4_9CHLO